MKSAKELFEGLGYICERSNDMGIIYRHYTSDKLACVSEIGFWLTFREYYIKQKDGSFIDVRTHKAITKQMEELGWLE